MKYMRCVLMFLLLATGVAHAGEDRAPTPAAPAGTVNVVTFVDVSTASIPRAIGLLRTYRDATAKAGISAIDLYQELGRPYRFAINEQWKDQASYDSQRQGLAATQLLAALKAMQSAPPESHVFQGYAVGPVRPVAGGRAQVYGICYFEIEAARLADFGNLVRPYVDAGRKDEGGMRLDFLQEANPRQTHILLFSSWNGPDEHEAHRISAHAQRFRESLAPLLSGSFDDRLYGKII